MATQAHTTQVPQQGHDPDAWKLFVFHKYRYLISSQTLIDGLRREIELLAAGNGSGLDALVRAGELETALADAGLEEATAAKVTDSVAAHVCDEPVNLRQILSSLLTIKTGGYLRCSHPEGFSYYGLNPLDFAGAAMHLRPQLPPHAAVIGIRSVGSALGAVVAAVLQSGNIAAERTTVRPDGEPYSRTTTFSSAQLAWIRRKLQDGSDFLVVDEGPGFSGSTLHSVVRALKRAGVPGRNITLICSRPIDDRLDVHGCGDLKNYRSLVVGYGKRIPPEADRQAGRGIWREMLYRGNSEWPACWTDLERIKHLSLDGTALFKFEGLGRFGALAKEQAQVLAGAGFSPALLGFDHGFARYHLERARPLNRQDLNPVVLGRIAEYCAFRAEHLAASRAYADNLLNMMEVNLQVEFRRDNPFSDLPIISPAYTDCRMMPHEWVLTDDGRILKTDSVGHGEGHQLPGPADIAWDLAGAIVEWELSFAETEFFLAEYRRLSGDDVSSRIHQYVVFYLAHRTAFCRMGAACMRDSGDGMALWTQYRDYAGKLKHCLDASSVDSGPRRVTSLVASK